MIDATLPGEGASQGRPASAQPSSQSRLTVTGKLISARNRGVGHFCELAVAIASDQERTTKTTNRQT